MSEVKEHVLRQLRRIPMCPPSSSSEDSSGKQGSNAHQAAMEEEKEPTMQKYLTLTLHDGSIYGIPVEIIARHRAASYADEFDGDIERSLAEDTLPYFEDSNYGITDWAANNMDWDDVKDHAVQLRGPQPIDFDEVWRTVPKEVQTR